MAAESFSHAFFDIEIDTVHPSTEVHLVKVLAVDGRRFTYELRGPLTERAVIYLKSLLDLGVFSDLVVEPQGETWESCESPTPLRKHS
jgi:hypothetical protein